MDAVVDVLDHDEANEILVGGLVVEGEPGGRGADAIATP
jgi:hypothetical protein